VSPVSAAVMASTSPHGHGVRNANEHLSQSIVPSELIGWCCFSTASMAARRQRIAVHGAARSPWRNSSRMAARSSGMFAVADGDGERFAEHLVEDAVPERVRGGPAFLVGLHGDGDHGPTPFLWPLQERPGERR